MKKPEHPITMMLMPLKNSTPLEINMGCMTGCMISLQEPEILNRRKIALDASTRKELERLYETADCAKVRQKAQVLLLATEGIYSYQRLGEIALRSRATVINWFNVFLSGGLDALLGDAERSGRPSELSGEISGAMAKGLEDGRWVTSGQVKEWLREEYGIARAGSTVRYWLGKTRRGAQGAAPLSRQEGRGSRRGLQSTPV